MPRASLSVVIPLYNHADVVLRAIESTLEQSRQPDEVLVVDDASTDSGPDDVARFAEKHTRVRLIRSEKNEGTPRTTNRGFSAARGEYVYGLSADDFVLPGFFDRAMAALESKPLAGLFYGDFLTVTQAREIFERTPSLPPVAAFYSPYELSDRLYGDILEARGAIFKRTALLDCGGLIPEFEEMSDWYLGLAVAFRHGLYYIPGACHAKRVDFTSYALKRQADRLGLQQKIRRIIAVLSRPENQDLLPHFARSAAFLHFGIDAAEAMLSAPECWDPIHATLLAEPLAQYMKRKRGRAGRDGRLRNRPHFERPPTWQKYVTQYTPEYLRPRVDALVAEWNRAGKRVVIYGAGDHTVALMKLTQLGAARIVGIADKALAVQGQRQWGFEVITPGEIARLQPDVVLISSAANQDEIYDALSPIAKLGIERVCLYEDVESDSSVSAGYEASPATVAVEKHASLTPNVLVPRIRELVSAWSRSTRRVVLYGAGEETSSLFKWTNIADANLVAIVEPVALLQGERIWNLETVAPNQIETLGAETVLICSNDRDGEIRRSLEGLAQQGVEILSLRTLEPPVTTRTRSPGTFATPSA